MEGVKVFVLMVNNNMLQAARDVDFYALKPGQNPFYQLSECWITRYWNCLSVFRPS